MRQNLLEQILRRLLTEQTDPVDFSDFKRDTRVKPKDIETDESDIRKRIVIKDAPESQIQYAEGYGAVNAFRVVFRPTKEGKDLISDNNLIDLLRDSILKHPQLGAGSKYDNGNYMYVFSENQSIKQRQVYNVWILDYAKLSSIANVINDEESSKTLKHKTDVKSIPWFMVDKIPVYTYKSAAQWLSLLKNKSKQLNLTLRDRKNLPYEFPDLTRINRRTVEVKPIIDQRFEEQTSGPFIGTVKITTDAYGKEQREWYYGSLLLTQVKGDIETERIFDGEFKNGRPFKGTLTNKDVKTGNIINIWDGEVQETPLGVVPNLKKGKYIKVKSLKYPIDVIIDNKKVSINNEPTGTEYVYGYHNDQFIQINKLDFENYLVNTDDPSRKMYITEPVTDPEIINILKTKIKIPVKKDDVPVVTNDTGVTTVITYPYTIKWLQSVDKTPLVAYKLNNDNTSVYFYNTTGTPSWYSMPLTEFETFDKVTPKKPENAPKQTKVTDASKISELYTISNITPKNNSNTPPAIVFKRGDVVKLINPTSTFWVFKRTGSKFDKDYIGIPEKIKTIKFITATGGKYAQVELTYKTGYQATVYVYKSILKK